MNLKPKKLIVFASGSATGGGSGFEKLYEATQNGLLNAIIVAAVSNHSHGGVYERATRLGVPFIHFEKPYTAEQYKAITQRLKADFTALSGWLKFANGVDPRTTFNIHPGPLPRFGGKGMYGHFVHEAVIEAYREGTLTHTEINMHFVEPDKDFDKGVIFFKLLIPINPDDTSETLATRVNTLEHHWQPIITNKVLSGEIWWDGKDPTSLVGEMLVNA